MNIRLRSVGILLAALLVAAPVQGADFGTKVAFKQDTAVPFAGFTLTFLGERRVASDKYPRGFLLYDFRVTSAQGTQTISWSAGTGDIAPLLFHVGGEAFTLELMHSDKLGRLKGNEMVVSRSP